MKKTILTSGALAVAALLAWRLAPRDHSNESGQTTPPKKASELLVLGPAGKRPTGGAHTGAPETTNIVSASYTMTPTGAVLVVRTQAIPVGLLTPELTKEKYRAHRERRRQELMKDEQYKPMFAKEAEWKEKSKALKLGMTLEEVTGVMGTPPTSRSEYPPAIPRTRVYYSPNPKQNLYISSLSDLPLDNLCLVLDQNENLIDIRWLSN